MIPIGIKIQQHSIYDTAHELARQLKNSTEFKEYQALTEEVYKKDENKSIIDDFRKKVFEYQMKNIDKGNKEDIEDEEFKNIQQLQNILMSNSEISKFMMAEIKFSAIMQDIYKILEEAIKMK